MGRKQEERSGACCCAVREGLLCERSSGAREKKRFPRHIAREKCLPLRGICPGSGLRAAEDFSSCGRRHTLENGVPRRSAKAGHVSAGGVGDMLLREVRGHLGRRACLCGALGLLRNVRGASACGGLAIRRVTPNTPFRPGAKDASSISKGRFVGPPASAPTRRLRPAPSRRMQGAKKGRRNADGPK